MTPPTYEEGWPIEAAHAPGHATPPVPAPSIMGRVVRSRATDRQYDRLSRKVHPIEAESILDEAISGNLSQQSRLFELMQDRWPRLLKNVGELKNAVGATPFTVSPYTEKGEEPTPEAIDRAKFVEYALFGMEEDPVNRVNDFAGTVCEIANSYLTAHAVLEIMWLVEESGVIVPKGTRLIPARYYRYTQREDEEDRLLMVPSGNYNGTLEEWTPDKFIIAVNTAHSAHPSVAARLRALIHFWIGATFGLQWFMEYTQLFGLPIRWAEYDPENKTVLPQIETMLENMGAAAWGAFPTGTKLNIVMPTSQSSLPQKDLIDLADRACDILILGQTLTTDVGSSGSRALGDVHASVRGDVIVSLAKFVARVLNSQLIPSIVRLNFGDFQDMPKLTIDDDAGDVGGLDAHRKAERDQILLTAGVPLPLEWFYKRHNVPQPGEDEDVLRTAPAPAPNPGEPPTEARFPVFGRGEKKSDLDRLIDAVLEDLTGISAEWLDAVRPMFEKLIRAALSKSTTDADFITAIKKAQDEIPELFDKMDHKSLEDAMRKTMGAAALNGIEDGSRPKK